MAGMGLWVLSVLWQLRRARLVQGECMNEEVGGVGVWSLDWRDGLGGKENEMEVRFAIDVRFCDRTRFTMRIYCFI